MILENRLLDKITTRKLVKAFCALLIVISLCSFSVATSNENNTSVNVSSSGITLSGIDISLTGTSTDAGLPKVAIYPSSYGLISMLESNGYQAAGLTSAQIENGDLSQYDVLIYQHDTGAATEATKTAIKTFLANGGGMVTEWSSSAVLLNETGSHILVVSAQWSFFNGTVDYGSNVATNTPIDIVDNDHRIFENIPDNFTGGGATEFFFVAQNLDPRLDVIANYTGHDGTWPAIAVAEASTLANDSSEISGSDGIVMLFFDAADSPSENDNMTNLWLNSINYVSRSIEITSPQSITNDSTPLLTAILPIQANVTWYVLDGNNGTSQYNTTLLNVTLPELTEGTHNLTVWMNDSSLILNSSLEFLVDVTSPVVNMTTNSTILIGSNGWINGTFIEDGAGIDNITVNGHSATIDDTTDSFSINGLSLVNGSNNITIVATDLAGNSNTTETTVIVDASFPIVTITEPSNETVWFIDNIVTGTITDASFESATLSVKNEAGNIINQYSISLLEDNSFRKRVEYASNQQNTLLLTAYDSFGNMNSTTRTITVKNSTEQQEISSVNESEPIYVDSINETGTYLTLVPATNATNVTITVMAITDETQTQELNDTNPNEVALGEIVSIEATGGIDGSNQSQIDYVLLSLYYDLDDLDLDGDGELGPGDIDESTISCYWYNESSSSWVKLSKGNPEWVIDIGRTPMSGDNPGLVWARVKHLSSYSLTGSLITGSTTTSTRHHNGDDYGYVALVNKILSESSVEDTETVTTDVIVEEGTQSENAGASADNIKDTDIESQDADNNKDNSQSSSGAWVFVVVILVAAVGLVFYFKKQNSGK